MATVPLFKAEYEKRSDVGFLKETMHSSCLRSILPVVS